MRKIFKITNGFTLFELLMVIVVIGILAALLFPVVRSAKDKAKKAACLNNVRQINLGVRMYSNDSNDASPTLGVALTRTNTATLYSGYKEIMKNYVGLKGVSSPRDRLFACPADRFYPSYALAGHIAPLRYIRDGLHDQPIFDFSSYVFNGGDNITRRDGAFTFVRPGLAGGKLSSVVHPSRTLLIAEASALAPWSWHQPSSRLIFADAKSMVSF